MRIDLLQWFPTNRKYVRIALTVGVLIFWIKSFAVVVGETAGQDLQNVAEISLSQESDTGKSVEFKTSPRRHSEDDDELHDSELLEAVGQSLHDWNQRRIRKKRHGHRVKRDEEVVCYGELGCFRDEGPFDYLDMLPSPPEEISTRFLLYTRSNRQNPQIFSYFNFTSSMYSSNFNATAPTKVIIHGFGSTCNRIWASEMRLTLLSVVECNIICVDWENGATLPNYVRAAVNTRLVGKQVALLILWLNEKLGSRTQDFHLIGFSLGAHVAGFAGQEVKNLSRITGLDPAGPLYESYDKKVRLDSSDALFVDVIHSNGDSLLMGGLGSWEPMGHVDFYPNGGRVQKGCSNLFLGAVRDFLWSGSDSDGRSLCNHRRAYKFFTESISPRCPFPAFSCDSYDKFLTGSCFTWDTSRCGNMGYFADRLPNRKQGLLYLVTREDEPFCANQYRITLESSPSSAPISTYGGIEAVLIGHDFINETFLVTKSPKENMVPGAVIQRMIVAHPAITEPVQIQLKYTAYQGWFHSGISRWSMDSFVLTNAYGKSVSFCARLLLPSGIPVTIRLSPGPCLGRYPTPTNSIGRPIFPMYPYDTPPTATDSTNGLQGATNPSDVNDTSPLPLLPDIDNNDNDLSIMKPPAMILEGNTVNHNPEDTGPAGPSYHLIPTGVPAWTSWNPISQFTPVETYQHVTEENVTTDYKTNQNHGSGETTQELPIVKLRICLVPESGPNSTTNGTLLSNMTCVHSEEESNTISGHGGTVMSNNALGQIKSYHQEVLRENELFHHTNAVEVEPSSMLNFDENPTSTNLSIPPESFWSSVHNKTQNVESQPQNENQPGDQPMPPYLSYTLHQLESQGLGFGPKILPDRLSHNYHEGVSNYLRGLMDRGDTSSTGLKLRRIVPSSRALKMRPVSLSSVSTLGSKNINEGAGGGGGHRRQSKILDLNFSPSEAVTAQGGHNSHHFTPRLQQQSEHSRWVHPPPPPPLPPRNHAHTIQQQTPFGTNTSPIFYVTKNQQPKNKGYFVFPQQIHQEMNHGNRIKIRRLLQPHPPPLQPSVVLPNESTPNIPKSYFEEFRQSQQQPRWIPQHSTNFQ